MNLDVIDEWRILRGFVLYMAAQGYQKQRSGGASLGSEALLRV